jgi:heat-inducible transcriptional repressor
VIHGVADALRLPEFSELQQVQMLLHLLEQEQNQVWQVIFDPPLTQQRRVKVVIGAENPLEPMRACTLIAAPYHQGTTTVGSVGVLGPTRMLYEKAISLVEAAADYLSTSLS